MDQQVKTDGWYHHPPGAPSRWSVTDTGLKCTHSCAHCFYVHMDDHEDPFHGMRHAKFHSTEWLIEVVHALKANDFRGTDFSGGEPSIHPGIVDIVAEATKVGLATRMITLGQFLTRKNLLERLLDAGICDFEFSHHAHTEELFHAMTGESLARQDDAMRRLDAMGFAYCTNTTITEKNYRVLPEIAREIVTHHGVYTSNFLQLMPLYKWSSKPEITEGVQARFADIKPYLEEAVSIVEEHGIGCNIRYAPMCSVRGMEKNMAGIVGVRYDAHEWTNQIDHRADDTADPEVIGSRLPIRPGTAPGAELFDMPGPMGDIRIIAGRGDPRAPSKVFPESCSGCSAMKVCDGIDPGYLQRHGASEFVPYTGPSRGSLLDKDRLAYLPVFKVKVAPWAVR